MGMPENNETGAFWPCDLCGSKVETDISVCSRCMELLEAERKIGKLDLLIAAGFGAVAGFVIDIVLMAIL